jgi:cell division protein FtsX
LWPATLYAGAKTADWFGGFNVASYYAGHFTLIFLILMGSGVVLGAAASVLAIRKYLNV